MREVKFTRFRPIRAFGVDPDTVLQVNPVGVMSFSLGAVTLYLTGPEGYHPEAWTVAHWGIALGALSFVWSVIFRQRLGVGWPILGLAISLFSLLHCRGMERREDRAVESRAIHQDWQRRGFDPLNQP